MLKLESSAHPGLLLLTVKFTQCFRLCLHKGTGTQGHEDRGRRALLSPSFERALAREGPTFPFPLLVANLEISSGLGLFVKSREAVINSLCEIKHTMRYDRAQQNLKEI